MNFLLTVSLFVKNLGKKYLGIMKRFFSFGPDFFEMSPIDVDVICQVIHSLFTEGLF